MNTFTKELTWVGYEIDTEAEVPVPIETERKKIATFKELSRTDPSQRKLIYRITKLFDGQPEITDSSDIGYNTDALSELVDKAVKDLLIVNQDFTDQDKKEFQQDNLALMSFGFWVMQNHFAPFFSKFKPT
jgi:hypothetical protein